MENREQKRQYMRALTAAAGIVFLSIVLFIGIRFNGFNDLLWWLALLSVVVLVATFIVVTRRRFG